MAVIRHISIQNFWAVRQAEWYPGPGLNCPIGPGDSGKSTIIGAIDLVLGARRSFTFSDAHFHLKNTATLIYISITLGLLCKQPCNPLHSLLEILWHSNFHFWHRAAEATSGDRLL